MGLASVKHATKKCSMDLSSSDSILGKMQRVISSSDSTPSARNKIHSGMDFLTKGKPT